MPPSGRTLSLGDKEGRTVRIGSAGYHEFDGVVVDLTTLLDVSLELLPDRIERGYAAGSHVRCAARRAGRDGA